MLVDEENSDVFALIGEAMEGHLDVLCFRLLIHDHEVLLRIRLCDMLSRGQQSTKKVEV